VDNLPEFTGRHLDEWAFKNRMNLHLIEPGKPVQNVVIASFNGKTRDRCLNRNTSQLRRVDGWIKIIHTMDNFYERRLASRVRAALSDTPVVLLNGARQTGKTTLALSLGKPDPGEPGKSGQDQPGRVRSYSFDDVATRAAARDDAAGFLAGLDAGASDTGAANASGPIVSDTLIVLDEVQHAPELFPALKMWVDESRMRGDHLRGGRTRRFLLTGSANVLLLPKVSESLAGRMEILTLWPLAQAEIEGASGGFVDALFGPGLFQQGPVQQPFTPGTPQVMGGDVFARVLRGGFPEALQRASAARRRAWFDSYLQALLQRDVRELSNIDGLSALPRLLQFLATRSAGLLNLSDVSRATTLPYATLHRYMSLLEATFLVHLLPAWSSHLGTRLVKAPKLMLLDTGLSANLMGVDGVRLQNDAHLRGALLENFIAVELLKLAGWSETAPRCFHFRTQSGYEVDFVLETADGRLAGVETKAAATVDADDFKGLRHLAEVAGENFVRGVVLYGGEKVIPFGDRLFAVPHAVLWG
jgi:predicted AAA+ superfamily ATPase